MLTIPLPTSASPIAESGIAARATRSNVLFRFYRVKSVDIPVNRATSLGEAEFYVAKYGANSAATLARGGDSQAYLCDASTTLLLMGDRAARQGKDSVERTQS